MHKLQKVHGLLYAIPADFGLDGEVDPGMLAEKRSNGRGCFYASGRRDRRVAADFAPGPEAETDGCATGWGSSLRLSPPTSRLARRQRKRGALMDGGFSTPPAADLAPGTEVDAGARY